MDSAGAEAILLGRAEWRTALRTVWRTEWKKQADADILRWRVVAPGGRVGMR
jgi:hypothetical protein